MTEFTREKRYVVLKTSKLNNDQIQLLGYALETLSLEQSAMPECVVVEADWPNYEDTWDSIKAVSEGQYTPKLALENEFYHWAKAHGLIVDGHPPHATVMQRYDELVFAEIPELKEQLQLAQDAQQVYWHSPDTAPAVAEGSLCLCWIAVRQHCEGTEPQVRVFAANYINKPLFLDEDGEPTAEDYHVTADGEPVGAVGWHNEHHHPEFSAYFEEITFSESYQLLGWAEYKPPMWGAV